MGKARDLANVGSVASTGLQFRNKIINGDFKVWQRGTSTSGITSGGIFVADRFQTSYGGGSPAGSVTYSRTTDVPPGFRYAARFEHASASTSPNEYVLRQFIEMQNARDLIGSPVAISFWYKSNRTGNHAIRFAPNSITGASILDANFVVNSANTWEYKTIFATNLVAGTGSSTADNDWGVHFDVGFKTGFFGLSSIAAGDYFQVTGIQLEKGTQATPFEFRPIGTELALCQRYFCKTYNQDVVPGSSGSSAYPGVIRTAIQTTNNYTGFGHWSFPAIMRATPTVTIYNPGNGAVNGFVADGANLSPATVFNPGQSGCSFYTNNVTVGTATFIAIAATANVEL